MKTIVFDECLAGLYEAQLAMNDWIDISPYALIYEADTPVVQKALQNNNQVQQKAESGLMKAINGIINLIKRVTSSIQDFIQRMFMSKDQKTAFDNFREACKSDPSLRDKKITVADFNKISKEYDSYINEVDNAIRAEAAGQTTAADELVGRVTSFLANAGKHAGIVVAASVAEKMAADKLYVARRMATQLTNESVAMEQLREAVGNKQAKKIQKNIQRMGKRFSLHRAKVHLLHGKSQSMIEAVQKTGDELSNLLHGKVNPSNMGLVANMAHNKAAKEIVGTVASAAITAKTDSIADKLSRFGGGNFKSDHNLKADARSYLLGPGQKKDKTKDNKNKKKKK